MSDGTPQSYHALSRAERDHLLAVLSCPEAQPTGADINRHVGTLRGGEDAPSNSTTYPALEQLTEWGLITNSADRHRGINNGYSITPEGRRVLEGMTKWLTA